MPYFCFFQKGSKVAVLDKADCAEIEKLFREGYNRQSEEIDAPDAEQALRHFLSFRQSHMKKYYH